MAAIELIVRLLAMHDTVGIVVPQPTPPESLSLADAILRVAPVRLGVLVACHCSLRGNNRLQLGYKRVIPALYLRYTRVIPAFVGALICCSRTAARLLSFALPSVIYASVSGAGVTTVSSACLCPQLPREFALQR